MDGADLIIGMAGTTIGAGTIGIIGVGTTGPITIPIGDILITVGIILITVVGMVVGMATAPITIMVTILITVTTIITIETLITVVEMFLTALAEGTVTFLATIVV